MIIYISYRSRNQTSIGHHSDVATYLIMSLSSNLLFSFYSFSISPYSLYLSLSISPFSLYLSLYFSLLSVSLSLYLSFFFLPHSLSSFQMPQKFIFWTWCNHSRQSNRSIFRCPAECVGCFLIRGKEHSLSH